MKRKKQPSMNTDATDSNHLPPPEARVLEAPDGKQAAKDRSLKKAVSSNVETVGTIKLPRGTAGAKQIASPTRKSPAPSAGGAITAITPIECGEDK